MNGVNEVNILAYYMSDGDLIEISCYGNEGEEGGGGMDICPGWYLRHGHSLL